MVASNSLWPDWWSWELDTGSPHLAKRMRDRQFTETDLRDMLECAMRVSPNHEPDRWVAETQWRGAAWEVVLEPLVDERTLLVITAYKVG